MKKDLLKCFSDVVHSVFSVAVSVFKIVWVVAYAWYPRRVPPKGHFFDYMSIVRMSASLGFANEGNFFPGICTSMLDHVLTSYQNLCFVSCCQVVNIWI